VGVANAAASRPCNSEYLPLKGSRNGNCGNLACQLTPRPRGTYRGRQGDTIPIPPDSAAIGKRFTVNNEQVFYRSRRKHLLDSYRLVSAMNLQNEQPERLRLVLFQIVKIHRP
jgi:hypothetical protein